MKKVIFSALVILSAAAASAFTVKNDTVATKHDSVSNKKEYSTADAKQTPRHTAVDNKKEYSTAD